MRPHVNIWTQRAHCTLEEAIKPHPKINPLWGPQVPIIQGATQINVTIWLKGPRHLRKKLLSPTPKECPPRDPTRRGNMGYLYKEQHKLNVTTIWTQSASHLRKSYQSPPKRKNTLLGPPKKRGVENPYKEQHKLSSSLCSGDWIETTPLYWG